MENSREIAEKIRERLNEKGAELGNASDGIIAQVLESELTKKNVPEPTEMVNTNVETRKDKILNFIYDRLINKYGESPNIDYMISFKEIISGDPQLPPSKKQPTEEFEQLYEFMEISSSSINRPKPTFAWGVINGYNWRLFQEFDQIINHKIRYVSWVGIYDEDADGSMVVPRYSIEDIVAWIQNHPEPKK